MGSISFQETLYTTADMNDAYRMAVEEGLHEYGHGSYSGSIATTPGVRLSPLTPDGNPVPISQLDSYTLERQLRRLDKFRPCEAVPILRTEPAETERFPGTVRIDGVVSTETLTISQSAPYRDPLATVLAEIANREVRKLIRADGAIRTVNTDGTEGAHAAPGPTKDYSALVVDCEVTEPPKVHTRATKGATETRYFIIPKKTQTLPAWDSGYSTQAKARAALPTSPERRNRSEEYEVVSMTRRGSGEGLVEHSVVPLEGKTVKVAISVCVQKILKPVTVTEDRGWLFYGWASY